MRIFAILDSEAEGREEIGYLFCFEKTEEYIIELRENLDEWTAPLLFSKYVKNGSYTIPKEASGLWVAERVIPAGRQNLGMILKNHGLSEYKEHRLLALSKGYSSQDSCYIREIKPDELPGWVTKRRRSNVRECFINNNKEIICLLYDNSALLLPLSEVEAGRAVSCSVETGGYGIRLDDRITVEKGTLLEKGKKLGIPAELFYSFARECVINTREACDVLGCTRQNLAYHIDIGHIVPLKEGERENLFLKGEVESYC